MKFFVRAFGITMGVGLAVVVLAILALVIRFIIQEVDDRRAQAQRAATATAQTQAASVTATAQIQARATSQAQAAERARVQATSEAVAAEATQAARQCSDPAKAVVNVDYFTRKNASLNYLLDYVARGSAKNTCNYMITVKLQFATESPNIYIVPRDNVFDLKNPLLPGESRNFNEVITWGDNPNVKWNVNISIYE